MFIRLTLRILSSLGFRRIAGFYPFLFLYYSPKEQAISSFGPMSSEDGESPYGYALRRNGFCLTDETDCGPTWGGYHACCPYSTTCPSDSATSVCCHYESDCTSLIVGHPHCGDKAANLYWANNYFCCSNGTDAFSQKDGWVGCTDDLSEVGSGMKQLPIVSSASASTSSMSCSLFTPQTPRSHTIHELLTIPLLIAIPTGIQSSMVSAASSTIASISATATATATSEASTGNSSSSSSTNTGAIAGGVVGGVAGVALLLVLAWFLYRRRNKQPQNIQPQTNQVLPQEIAVEYPRRPQVVGELDTYKDYGPAELPSYR